ncbi:MAG TPA: PIG-L family deacetylase [Candidatus Dormibacteraeota bacterium]|nr:PIG-L family deacetylase [Candidatus Dormibacteraeota bacterium]
MNPYPEFVSRFADLIEQAKSYPLGGFAPAPKAKVTPEAGKALFFSPHPDDECISGGIALRILRETGMAVANVAVTQGSKKERQGERLQELKGACNYLGFDLITTGPNGLEKVIPKTRSQDQPHWSASVEMIHKILSEHRPRVIMFPHEHDWNSTHIGTHFLVMDALSKMPADYECYLVETEFWGQMNTPNLMVEISSKDIADMITAITFHIGEVKRNPYHLLLPAWMMDNVRRGSELVGGQGGAAPDFKFAALYRLRKWSEARVQEAHTGGKQTASDQNIGTLFA